MPHKIPAKKEVMSPMKHGTTFIECVENVMNNTGREDDKVVERQAVNVVTMWISEGHHVGEWETMQCMFRQSCCCNSTRFIKWVPTLYFVIDFSVPHMPPPLLCLSIHAAPLHFCDIQKFHLFLSSYFMPYCCPHWFSLKLSLKVLTLCCMTSYFPAERASFLF